VPAFFRLLYEPTGIHIAFFFRVVCVNADNDPQFVFMVHFVASNFEFVFSQDTYRSSNHRPGDVGIIYSSPQPK
jgi:hypothetical protein